MVEIDGHHLTIGDIILVAREREKVSISPTAGQLINESHERLTRISRSGKAVYGINTGFGIFADRRISDADSGKLSRNLILSHAVGAGEGFSEEIVRAGLLVRANTLAKGYSGVRYELVDTMIALLNQGVTPVVPSQGSLGSSGDLIPLSHMALIFTTDEKNRDEDSGFAYFDGKLMSGAQAMRAAGIERIRLGPKEGLALNNGATFSAAVSAIAAFDAAMLLDTADLSLALSLEAMLGCSNAFDARLHSARGHEGQMKVAERVLDLVAGSEFIDKAERVQDAYSLRCAPQVHGAARDTVGFVEKTIRIEINAATDNPLLFEPETAISGGNFHGEPVGMAADFLAIAMAEVGAISERRTYRLTDGKQNSGLPPMLVDNFEAAGLNSGLMMPQYTAAALMLENQTLCTPDSVHSLPTSGGQEDHNANSMTAARHALQVIKNTSMILSIELYTAARAMDLRQRTMPEATMGKKTHLIYEKIRSVVPYQAGDAWWGPEINEVNRLVAEGELVSLSK